jgi:hypothetical protein
MSNDYLVSAVGDSIQKIKNMDSGTEIANTNDFKANADFLSAMIENPDIKELVDVLSCQQAIAMAEKHYISQGKDG